ncbi:unnamed protein product [Arctogadus glacialis]
MPVLRKWWCTVLLENFHLDGHGRRFPHFMEEAKQMAAELLPPVFRLKRKRDLDTIGSQGYLTSSGFLALAAVKATAASEARRTN